MNQPMRKMPASWVILLSVTLIVAVVPGLREQARLQWDAGLLPPTSGRQPGWWQRPSEFLPADVTGMSSVGEEWMNRIYRPHRQRLAEHIESSREDDFEALLALGLISERPESVSLLRRAAEVSDKPAAWAAYAAAHMHDLEYWRVETGWADLDDPAQIAEYRAFIAEQDLPEALPVTEARTLLDALRSWAQADSENGLPVALEAWALYGLGRDAAARARWLEASRLPTVDCRHGEQTSLAAEAHMRRGMPEVEAHPSDYSGMGRSFGKALRQGARMAWHEGRLAQLHNRSAEAIGLWRATADLGLKLQESADQLHAFRAGVTVVGIGVSPAWQWHADGSTGVPNGPIYGGRVWYGPRHEFFVSQIGGTADAALRDRLLRGNARSHVWWEYARGQPGVENPYTRAAYLLFLGTGLALELAVVLALLLIVRCWAGRKADNATALRPRWQLIIAGTVALPLPLVAIPLTLLLPVILDPAGEITLAVPILAALVLTLVATRLSRRCPAGTLAAWRGHIRSVLPVVAALLALSYLASSIAALALRHHLKTEYRRHNWNEMAYMVEELGSAFTDPRIPPDSWRAEYPPELPAQ